MNGRQTAESIGALIHSQDDSHATRDPIYIVQKRERLYGFDTKWTDDVVWLNDTEDHREATPAEHEDLDRRYDDTGDEPDDWTRTGFADRWEFVTCCFTDAAARAFIEANKHRHTGEMRVFVDSLYRNDEMIAVREHLLSIARTASPLTPPRGP